MSKLPEPGYYRSGDADVLVIDPATLADAGEVVTKDSAKGDWTPAVAFRLAFVPGSPLYVLSADVFDARFEPTTHEDALGRVQEREREEATRLAAEENEEEPE
jgi:hypothetical protein